MNPLVKSRFDMIAAWSGPVSLMLFVVGWVGFAGFLTPVHPPSATAEEIASIYRADYTGIRIGMILVMFSALLTIPFSALIVKVLAKIEGGMSILSLSALFGGAANMVLAFYPAMWWLLAAFRPERDPELIQLINDAAWLQLIGGVSIFLAIPLSMAVAAFCDTSPDPVFPRWSGYVNLWVALLLIPGELIFFFYRGIFAWNGLFGFYIPLATLGGWYGVAFILLRRAVLRERLATAPREGTLETVHNT